MKGKIVKITFKDCALPVAFEAATASLTITIPCPVGKLHMLSFNYFTSPIPRKAVASGIIPLGELRFILGRRL